MAALLTVCSCFGEADTTSDEAKPQDLPDDAESAERLIAQGDSYRKGVDCQQDDVEAARMYQAAADLGDAVGSHKLAWMFANGRGVGHADMKQAVYYYELAASRGLLASQNNLGAIFRDGRGVPQDYELARTWFRKAAEKGLAQAMFNLGVMYALSLIHI